MFQTSAELLTTLRGALDPSLVSPSLVSPSLVSPSLVLAYVFGSRARGDARADSDLDVAVLADRPMDLHERACLVEDLARCAGLSVDLVDLSDAPPLLRFQVAREGTLIWAQSPERRLKFELQAVRDYEDTRHLRAQQQTLIKEFVSRARAT